MRRRVAYSLAIVRLILAPVIFLAIYYLFRMGWIVDRIVSVDAPAATLSQQASIEMLEARRAERNYLLLRDPSHLQGNHESVAKLRETLNRIQSLEPGQQSTTQRALDALNLYQQQFGGAVSGLGAPGEERGDPIQVVVRAYETDLNDLLRQARFKRRSQLVDELRSRVGSFDAQISKTVQEGDPALRQVTADLQTSSEKILQLASELEAHNWNLVQDDHEEAQHLIHQAEWALGSVSVLTFFVSIWISFILPRQVVKPLMRLKEAVDHAAAGNYEINFDIQGEGEVVQLANSFRNLVAHISQRT
ncbi:MAG: HAMP domain-containing protein [Candidatus Acidiferrales bacterium]